MKKIAIPLLDNILCSHFGHSQQFAVFETDGDKIVKKEYSAPPPHEQGTIPRWLNELGVTDVIVGGIGQRAIQILIDNKINVYYGVVQKPSEELIDEFLRGSLEAGVNLCDH